MSAANKERCHRWYMENRRKEWYKRRKREWQKQNRYKQKQQQQQQKQRFDVLQSHLENNTMENQYGGKYTVSTHNTNNAGGLPKDRKYSHKTIAAYDKDDINWDGRTYDDYAEHVVFQHPFTMLIAGPTGSGKTCWITRLLANMNVMIKPNVSETIWFHGQDQESHKCLQKEFPRMDIVKGLPDVNAFDPSVRRLIIVDDLMNQLSGNVIADMFTKGSHHTNTSVILAVQNVFSRNKEMRDISLNSHYMVIMKNPRDRLQVRNLDVQMYPGKNGFLTSCYDYATRNPHGYLLLTMNQKTDDMVRIRTNIFPGDDNIIFGPPPSL